ncbi:MAG: hypothetical protein Q9219_001413 [cf. Caloplaca sp. 3 TL-2023]
MPLTSFRKIVVLSGGTAANSLVDVFNDLIEKNNCTLSYIIPISDNGGSSSELIRVFGGPGIGDVRSRLVRLIPPSNAGILHLFNHRLPSSPSAASAEFLTLLDLTSPLYKPIPTPQALLIRSILSHLHLEILKRTRSPTSTFNFQSASIGNLFLTGARLFSGSFESAIYLFAIIGGVDESRTAVLPAVVSNFTHHICAGLEDGTVITGQNAISHPSAPTALPGSSSSSSSSSSSGEEKEKEEEEESHAPTYPLEDATLPGSIPSLRPSFLTAQKSHPEPPLPAPIRRIWYINPYGQEMHPSPNPNAVAAVRAADAVIYSIGSLYTSLMPILILRGVGEAVERGPRWKVLVLNGSEDRETLGSGGAVGFVRAVVRGCLTHLHGQPSDTTASSAAAAADGTQKYGTHSHDHDLDPDFHPSSSSTVRRFLTHIVYIDHPSAPHVDKDVLASWGVECVRCYGRKGEDGKMRYDGKGLGQALGWILGGWKGGGGEEGGGGGGGGVLGRSRRNTVEGGGGL